MKPLKEFLPFSKPEIGEEEIAEVADTLRSGWITTGPKSARFEKDFAEYLGVKHALAVASATAGLHISYLALGVKPGDEVITTPMTFACTLSMLLLLGAKPVLVDIDRETGNIDPKLIERAVTPRTVGIVPVHYAGQPVDIDAIRKIADAHGLWVMEDAAHAAGARYKGKKIGSHSEIVNFSFHPIKNMTTGEGGLVATNDDALAARIKRLRFHGMDKDAFDRYDKKGALHYSIAEPGFKYNFMDIQAAIGIHQLKKLDAMNAARTKLAAHYDKLFRGFKGIRPLGKVGYDIHHSWHLYVIVVQSEQHGVERDDVMLALKELNIGNAVHFRAAHLHPFAEGRVAARPGDLPNAEYLSDRIISIPFYPSMPHETADVVVEALGEIIAGK
jgi:dTDP-4-amino-4,6-dideoxygalactose transaminase